MKKLTRKSVNMDVGQASSSTEQRLGLFGKAVNRRTFLRHSGVATGGAALASVAAPTMISKVRAAETSPKADVKTEVKLSVCTHCSVGCGVVAEVQDGVWTGQEPDYDSPLNLGGHCAKGASVREHGHGERRVKYPMKLTGGKWKKVSWEEAIEDIGDQMMDIRAESGPDSVYWLGSAKFNNEQSYLCLLYTSPSPRDQRGSRMPSSA